MAGGPHARKVACDGCRAEGVRAAAVRVREGSETDHYACERGHTFGLEWRQIPSAPMWPEPAAEEVQTSAYFRWLARGGGDGGALGDWLAAERELGGG